MNYHSVTKDEPTNGRTRPSHTEVLPTGIRVGDIKGNDCEHGKAGTQVGISKEGGQERREGTEEKRGKEWRVGI